MRTLILTRAHYRRRYGNDAPESSIPSRFLEEVPPELVENLGGRSPAWSTAPYRAGRRGVNYGDDSQASHYNYEDESQEIPASSGQRYAGGSSSRGAIPKSKSAGAPPARSADSIDNIAKFFGGGRAGSFPRPAMDIPESKGAAGLKQGQRVRHAKYGEGQVLMREGEGEDAKLTVMFPRHGMKKLMEKFANLEKI
jgi:DNA helicase-2/ATP-dependent DNA helicase PcrA